MFLLDAAGNISKELINNIPIHLIDIITIIAINTTNILSISFMFIPLLFANEVFILITFNLLNVKYQKHNTDINVKNKYTISAFVILKMSPTRQLEYLLKLPLCASIAKPSAMAIEENTLIIVSAPIIHVACTKKQKAPR